ncbi:MAG: hypothetical protein J6U23_01355 [Clostridiales bacterium]|nr:hypothetical protein [Clostridiales bacterium]
MKKSKKTALIAASFALAMGMAGCVPPDDSNETEVNVRAKESVETSDVQTDYGAPIDPDVQTEYGVPIDYEDPSESEVEDVYGPPVDYTEET